jgi:nicotinate phosphoribosyltransferase
VTLLVDTYDTEEGVRVAADVLRDLDLAERAPGCAVRLDSGDLGDLAVRAGSIPRRVPWRCGRR